MFFTIFEQNYNTDDINVEYPSESDGPLSFQYGYYLWVSGMSVLTFLVVFGCSFTSLQSTKEKDEDINRDSYYFAEIDTMERRS